MCSENISMFQIISVGIFEQLKSYWMFENISTIKMLLTFIHSICESTVSVKTRLVLVLLMFQRYETKSLKHFSFTIG